MTLIGAKAQFLKKKHLVVELDHDMWLVFGQLAKLKNSDRSKLIRIWITDFIKNTQQEIGDTWQPKFPKVKLRKKQGAGLSRTQPKL